MRSNSSVTKVIFLGPIAFAICLFVCNMLNCFEFAFNKLLYVFLSTKVVLSALIQLLHTSDDSNYKKYTRCGKPLKSSAICLQPQYCSKNHLEISEI